MNKEISNEMVIKSLFYKFLERGGTQLIQFIIQVVLARLLMPKDFGMIAIVVVFINLARVFVQGGLATSLVQKKDTDELDYSSVFYTSIVIATIIYSVIFLSSPFIASVYGQPILENVLKVLGLILFFGAFNSIQNAFIAKNMLFHKLLIISLISVIVSGFFGVLSAYNDLGVWALVIQQLAYNVMISLTLVIFVRWYPKLIFSFERVKKLYSFGWKLLVSGLINVLYQDIRTLVIGIKFSAVDLAYYDRGKQIPGLLIANINGSIQSVLLPALSAYQNNRIILKNKMRRGIKISSFIIMPMMFGLAVVAEPLVSILLTDKWLPAVPFIQILSFTYALWPIHTANLQAINALGRSDVFLKLEIFKVIISIIVLIITLSFGVIAIAIGGLFAGILASFINAYPNKHLLNYSYFEQIKDISPSIIVSSIMALIIYPISMIINNNFLVLIIQIFAGGFIYFLLSYLFKLDSYTYIENILKNKLLEILNRKKRK